MWAYTDEEIDFLSTFRPKSAERSAASTAGKAHSRRGEPSLPAAGLRIPLRVGKWLKDWTRRQADMLELRRLDDRSLADLGINQGDFPAILDGRYARGGHAAEPDAGPRGELASRTLAMPADANPSGAIFGGWVMALMDAAGAMTATRIADGRVVTVSVSNITFLHPLQVGDAVCCYADIARIGRTSLTLTVEVWVLREGRGDRIKVTDAEFTFVAVDAAGRPRRLPRGSAAALA